MLIHMSIILAMGKNKRQKYHINGVHLHPMIHMPCYTVNVFFYLIDINKKNGGTDFYYVVINFTRTIRASAG